MRTSRVVSEEKLNALQLQELETSYLEDLREAVKSELSRRRKAAHVNQRRCFIEALHPNGFEDNVQMNLAIQKKNSSNLLAVRGIEHSAKTRKHYLEALLKQDWSHIFSGGDTDEKYYVYVHVDPNEHIFIATPDAGGNYGGQPFYVGKGCGKRAFDLKRNQGHGKRIKAVLDNGYVDTDIAKIIFANLSEAKAYEIEAKLIYFFGTVYELNRDGWLYNLEQPRLPMFGGDMTNPITKREFAVQTGRPVRTETSPYQQQ